MGPHGPFSCHISPPNLLWSSPQIANSGRKSQKQVWSEHTNLLFHYFWNTKNVEMYLQPWLPRTKRKRQEVWRTSVHPSDTWLHHSCNNSFKHKPTLCRIRQEDNFWKWPKWKNCRKRKQNTFLAVQVQDHTYVQIIRLCQYELMHWQLSSTRYLTIFNISSKTIFTPKEVRYGSCH